MKHYHFQVDQSAVVDRITNKNQHWHIQKAKAEYQAAD